MIDTEIHSKKVLLSILFLGLFIAIFTSFIQLFGVRDIFVMCDVGQGDGMYLRSGTINIVIDAGKQTSAMSNCLSKHIPYFDKTIDLAFISNSDIDHYGGYFNLLDHYDITRLIITNVTDGDPLYQQLIQKFKKHNTTIEFLYSGDEITLPDTSTLIFLWPTKRYIENATKDTYKEKDKTGEIFAVKENINSFSQVFLYKNVKTSILFTGDITDEVISNYLIDSLKKINVLPIDILKLAHHGSKNGITEDFIRLLRPKMAVVSAGYNNSYKHPSKETVELLHNVAIPLFITFEKGDIRVNTQNETVTPSFTK